MTQNGPVMTENGPAMTQNGTVPTRRCAACGATVPATAFCGECGAGHGVPSTVWTRLLRPAVYATAHRERVWTPRVSSTLFPRLTGPSRAPFRVDVALILGAIAALSALRAIVPLGVVSTIGLPLLFLIYVWQSDVVRDVGVGILSVAMILGVGSGVGWWVIASALLADTYDVTRGSGLALTRVVDTGLMLSMVGGLLMLLPALVCRFLPMPERESLDGFVIGAFGALCYSTAASVTVVTPQLVEGLMQNFSTSRLLQDAVTYGVVTPVVTMIAGGLFGLLLFFSPDRRDGHDGKAGSIVLIVCAIAAVALYALVWIIDGSALSHAADTAAKLAVSALAVLTARIAVQSALLHEAPAPQSGDPVLCVHCEKVVPDMAFCSSCGVAALASSRSSRRLRRESPPVPALSGADRPST